jgi:ribonuclease P/MRP protein subunit POP1
MDSFPPKNGKARIATEELPSICKPWECFPTASLAWSDIWDRSVRDAIETPRFTKKELDSRRGQNAVPGTSLKPTVSDNRVPILLIQRSVKPASTSSASLSTPHPTQTLQRNTKPDPNLHGWTLVVPKGWGMPFLTSLIYTGTRVGGQREREHQAFEAGAAYFPRDFPTCTAYEQFATARAAEDKERWKKKPPAKRVSWGKLSALSPWTSAWRVALGLDHAPSGETEADDACDEDVVPTQRDDDPPPASDPTSPAWLLHGSRARTIVEHVSRLLSPASGLLCEINALRRKCELPPPDTSVEADVLLQGALMHVRVLPCGRGALDDMAFIYALEDQEARAWVAVHGPQALVGYEVGEEPMDATEVSSKLCSRWFYSYNNVLLQTAVESRPV